MHGTVHKVRHFIFDQIYNPSPITLCHISEHPTKVCDTLELENRNECPVLICASGLCKELCMKLQLYCIVLYCKTIVETLKSN